MKTNFKKQEYKFPLKVFFNYYLIIHIYITGWIPIKKSFKSVMNVLLFVLLYFHLADFFPTRLTFIEAMTWNRTLTFWVSSVIPQAIPVAHVKKFDDKSVFKLRCKVYVGIILKLLDLNNILLDWECVQYDKFVMYDITDVRWVFSYYFFNLYTLDPSMASVSNS